MSQGDLPQPIYPSGGPEMGSPSGPPPGGPGGVDPKVWIGVGVVALVVVLGLVALLITRSGGDEVETPVAETPDPEVPAPEPADPDPPVAEAPADSGVTERADVVAATLGFSPGRGCAVGDLEQNAPLLEAIEATASAIPFPDEDLAHDYAHLFIDCGEEGLGAQLLSGQLGAVYQDQDLVDCIIEVMGIHDLLAQSVLVDGEVFFEWVEMNGAPHCYGF